MSGKSRAVPQLSMDGGNEEEAAGETRRMLRLSDIRMHKMDISIPNEKQSRVYAGMAGSVNGRRGLPPVRVGYWIDADTAAITDNGGRGGKPAAGAGAGGRSAKGGRNGNSGGSRVMEIAEKYKPPFYYLLADGDVFRGYMKGGGPDRIECVVVKCETESDFLTRHALVNQRHTSYDPLKLGRVVRWMQAVSRGGDNADGGVITRAEAEGARRGVDDVMRACRDTVDQKFINLQLDDGAIDVISEMCAWLGSKLSRFELPLSIPNQVSKAPLGVQVELAELISEVVRGGEVNDAKFSWPAPVELAVLANTPEFRGEPAALDDKSGGSRVTAAVPEADSGRTSRSRKKGGAGARSVPAAAKAQDAAGTAAPRAKKDRPGRIGGVPLQNTRDAIVIPAAASGEVKHPPYVVDMKTRRVSAVDMKAKVTVLREVSDQSSRKGAYLLPVAACEHLRLPGTAAAGSRTEDSGDDHNGNSVRLFTFTSPAGLAKFAERQERELAKHPGRKSRGVVIYI